MRYIAAFFKKTTTTTKQKKPSQKTNTKLKLSFYLQKLRKLCGCCSLEGRTVHLKAQSTDLLFPWCICFFHYLCASGAHKSLKWKQDFNCISWDKQESVCIFSYINFHKIRIGISPQSWIPNCQTLKICGTVSSTDWGQWWLRLCTKENILYCIGSCDTQCVGGRMSLINFDAISLHFCNNIEPVI